MTRYDVKTWRKSANGKPYTVRVGSAWHDKGGVIRIAFDALPLPDDKGIVAAFLEERKEEAERPSRPAVSNKHQPRDLDDNIPF